MDRRRGKQPVRPDVKEALKERLVYLKGLQGSTMNIPIIYRRTFGWEGDTVLFRPVNRHSFIVDRTDLPDEELYPEKFTVLTLDTSMLPWYSENRKTCSSPSMTCTEELREALTALSLPDRYTHVDVKRPKDRGLDACLRTDLEALSPELGYSLTSVQGAYRCTFLFPKLTNQELVKKAVDVLKGSVQNARTLVDTFSSLEADELLRKVEDMDYSIERAEINLDRIYIDALNIEWDVPKVLPVSHFLLIQTMERIQDELEWMMEHTRNALSLLMRRKEGPERPLLDELRSLWTTAVSKAVTDLMRALGSYEGDRTDSIGACFTIIREYRELKESRYSSDEMYSFELSSHLNRYLSDRGVRGRPDLRTRKELALFFQTLFSINQSITRLEELTKEFATTVLYVALPGKCPKT